MAEYYMLDKSHRAPFTPFLYPSDREDSRLRVVGAAEGKLAIGALAISDAGDGQGLLRSIAVSPEWQRRGVALGMLEYARAALPKLGRDSLMTCLAPELPGQEPVKALLKKAGFQASSGPVIAECPLSAFLESPALKPFLGGKHAGVVPLGQVPGAALKKMNGKLLSGGDLALPLDWERFSPSMSFCGMADGVNITCCVCLRRWKRGGLCGVGLRRARLGSDADGGDCGGGIRGGKRVRPGSGLRRGADQRRRLPAVGEAGGNVTPAECLHTL